MSAAEWALIAPLIPPAKRGGRPRDVNLREVMNGVLYVLETGCQWRALPKDPPPRSTVHDDLMLWDRDGTLERTHHELYLMPGSWRASPNAGVIDSQSVKGADTHTLVGRENSDALSTGFVPGVDFCISS